MNRVDPPPVVGAPSRRRIRWGCALPPAGIATVAVVAACAFGAFVLVVRDFIPPSYPRYEALIAAIDKPDPVEVKRLLDTGTDPNKYPDDDASVGLERDMAPLNDAAHDGNLAIVRELLDHKADPNIADGWFRCPLEAAAQADRVVVMQCLVERGAVVNDYNGWSSALWSAAVGGNAKALKFLLAHGANPNQRTDLDGHRSTLLHELRNDQSPNAAIIDILVKAGAKDESSRIPKG